MAEANKKEAEEKKMPEASSAQPVETKLHKAGETKVKFLVWFSGALDRFDGLKAHHLHSVQAFYKNIGLSDPETPKAYDEGMAKFGFRGKN